MKTLIINLKAYKEAIDYGVAIAQAAKEVSKGSKTRILLAAPYTVLHKLSQITGTLAQHIDNIEPGAHTGQVSWYEVKAAGAVGTLINHSENKLPLVKIKNIIDVCRKNGLESYACASNLAEAKRVAAYKPDCVVYEPPELIGGNVSVTTANPRRVIEFTSYIRGVGLIPLIGAGIKSTHDAKRSVDLGSDGILVSSSVVKASNYKASIGALTAMRSYKNMKVV